MKKTEEYCASLAEAEPPFKELKIEPNEIEDVFEESQPESLMKQAEEKEMIATLPQEIDASMANSTEVNQVTTGEVEQMGHELKHTRTSSKR